MTVYVDELRDYTEIARAKKLPATHWAHLTADDRDELHAFATRLGLRRSWFQDDTVRWHYDVTPGKRVQAVSLGAIEVTFWEIGALLAARRWNITGGPCAGCGTRHHRYGPGGGPLCPTCRVKDGG